MESELRAVMDVSNRLERERNDLRQQVTLVSDVNTRQAALIERLEARPMLIKVEFPASIGLQMLPPPVPVMPPAATEAPLPDEVEEACQVYAFPGSAKYRHELALNRVQARKLLAVDQSEEDVVQAIRMGRQARARPLADSQRDGER